MQIKDGTLGYSWHLLLHKILLGLTLVNYLELQGVFKGEQLLRLRCLAQVPRALRPGAIDARSFHAHSSPTALEWQISKGRQRATFLTCLRVFNNSTPA